MTPSKPKPKTSSKSESIEILEDEDGIDWDKVDTDELEHQAILSTPGSSQRASGSGFGSQDTPARERLRAAVAEGAGKRGGETPSRDRLRAAVEEGMSKRKREDDDQTPRRARVDSEVSCSVFS